MQTVKKAVIPAAGLGTRFLPATKAIPKEMLPIVDKPTIQYIVEEAVASGIEDILIISGRTKRAVEDHFDKSYELENELKITGKDDFLKEVEAISHLANIHYVRQREALGLGHAIYCAKAFVGNDPFVVMLGDVLCYTPEGEKTYLKEMIDLYDEKGASVIGTQEVPQEDVHKYGIVDGKEIKPGMYVINSLIEKPKPGETASRSSIFGRYVISPQIFEILENTRPGRNNEIQLTDALNTLAQQGNMLALDYMGKYNDVGHHIGFLEATVEYALRRPDLKDEFATFLKGLQL
ncbi:MAG: UTP--glucose-1-phosphate uridylyltransferase GalU [Oscillospiraceae bacterium]|nr:UTP--glucose-1-phosphate uridylyltransferase GalU [Oscillospiraceae bacterium]